MHNCRETKEQITEFLLDGADRAPDEVLSAELRGCTECCSEFDALKATLRLTTRLRDCAAPAESYWIAYHDRLRQRVEDWTEESHAKAQRRKVELRSFFAPLHLCVRTAVPVPVPLVVAVILSCAALGLFVIVAARQPTAQSPLIVHVPVEVPVIQEKIVTRVVYRERRPRSKRMTEDLRVNSTLAKSQKPRSVQIPPSLAGFKPTEEVKLTVIKGGSTNEK